MDTSLKTHYAQLLGLQDPWSVSQVNLDLEGKSVEIALEHGGGRKVECPECGGQCAIADHSPERRWRHLDTMQFETVLRARLPRADCPKCGVKTTEAPWSGKHSRFTAFFEAFALEVIEASSSVSAACKVLRLSWKSAHAIMERAVERGLKRRKVENLRHVGVDEKSFGRGHNYISVMSDLEGSRILEVVADRSEESAAHLWKEIPEEQRGSIEAVAMDMWKPFMTAARKAAPQAEIVHDRFHISKHLNEAVDQVRRREHRELSREGEYLLKKTRYLWLRNVENVPEQRWESFEKLQQIDLKTSRAWALKENFRCFWDYSYAANAARFFNRWHGWAVRSRLRPIKEKARMLKSHLDGILSYFRHPITNAITEGFNSRIQAIKAAARGFRSFRNYRTRILFYCGKLNLSPLSTH